MLTKHYLVQVSYSQHRGHKATKTSKKPLSHGIDLLVVKTHNEEVLISAMLKIKLILLHSMTVASLY